ncbi:MAG TPA: hydroxymethylbilane synthase [Candidatus Dormibacteraeota bacterium]|nr:hydroxymethylbilane synthase [Candidatus Dormibacteraeota bacterium]
MTGSPDRAGGVIRLATRGSALALAQTALAAARLTACGAPGTETVVIRTSGDRSAAPAAEMEGAGWFTAELEAALLGGRADAAVHSAKDLPTALAAGAGAVIAIVDRADPRDALVLRGGERLDGLPAGAAVGTSSLRREAFLRELRPDLRAVPIRGNVDTRIRKLDAGEVDGLLLAAAGLDRLGLGARATLRLDAATFVPAPAQGAIAVESAGVDERVDGLLAAADDALAHACVRAERAVLEALGGGCRLPLGAWARIEDGEIAIVAALAAAGGVRRVESRGDQAAPERLGRAVAEALRP